MECNNVKIMVSADWHIGATEPRRFRLELLKTIQPKLESGLDLFIIAGDSFDMKEYLSSEVVKTYLLILKELLLLTEPYNTEFRIIEGTRTHDAMQLDTMQIIFNELLGCDRIKFISKVERETIFDINILYVPEEYVVDSEVYYKKYFENHYDILIGHGMTDLMWYAKNDAIRIEKQTSAPVFKVDTLCEVADYIYFGHVHYHTKAGTNKRFKYIGPFSRWEFDKEKPCGLYYIEYDTDTKKAKEEFIINQYAPVLPSLIISLTKNYTIDDLIHMIQDKLQYLQDNSDKVRLIVNIDTSLESFPIMRDFIMSAYGNLKDVKLVLKLSEKETNKSDTPKKTLEEAIEEKPYLYDNSMRDESRIAEYIKKKGGSNISLEDILEVISPKKSKIKVRED